MNTTYFSAEDMAAMRSLYPDLDSYESWKAAGCPFPAQNWPDDPPQIPKPSPAEQQHTPRFHPANTVVSTGVILALMGGRGRTSGSGRGRGRGSRNVLNRQSRKANGRYRDGQ